MQMTSYIDSFNEEEEGLETQLPQPARQRFGTNVLTPPNAFRFQPLEISSPFLYGTVASISCGN